MRPTRGKNNISRIHRSFITISFPLPQISIIAMMSNMKMIKAMTPPELYPITPLAPNTDSKRNPKRTS